MAKKAMIDPDAKCPARAGVEVPEHLPDQLAEDAVKHLPWPELVEESGVAVRTVCSECGGVAGEWETKEAFMSHWEAYDIGYCPGCEETVVHDRVNGELVDDQLWHYGCWLESEHGYEHIDRDADVDRPWSRNANAEFNYHREVETEIGGETYTWDEWEIDNLYPDHGKHNLPTRADLDPEQLEILREWSLQSKAQPESSTHGTFPAEFVLVGGYRTDVPEVWICPDCGELVWPKEDHHVDITAECENCGSDRWITHGEPLTGETQDWADALSDRERQAVTLTLICDTHTEVAENMDIEVSTVRQYLERARQKAIRGKNLHDALTSFGVLSEEVNADE